ncbi:hypothetical protein SNEBB_001299 [Seison nebaliae]|nr:hypothetical protein SNEBB_001299 [Seison nebaliae]
MIFLWNGLINRLNEHSSSYKHFQRLIHQFNLIKNHLIDGHIKYNFIFHYFWNLMLGWLFFIYFTPSYKRWNGVDYFNSIILRLKDILKYLSQTPAGLKLNAPLNKFLMRLFCYHLDQWSSYLWVWKNIYLFITGVYYVNTYFGLIFGIGAQIAFIIDILKILSLHVLIFYSYIAKIIRGNLLCIKVLFRLFRAKKWNDLQQTEQSTSYEPSQLFLGCLLLTINIFLFPTFAVYYTVFGTLRFGIKFLLYLLEDWILFISMHIPFYEFFIKIPNGKRIKFDKQHGKVMTENVYMNPIQSYLHLLNLEQKFFDNSQLNNEIHSPLKNSLFIQLFSH